MSIISLWCLLMAAGPAKQELELSVNGKAFRAHLVTERKGQGIDDFTLQLLIETGNKEVFRSQKLVSGAGAIDNPLEGALYAGGEDIRVPLGLKAQDLTGDGQPEIIFECTRETEDEIQLLIVDVSGQSPKVVFDSTQIKPPSASKSWVSQFLIKSQKSSSWIEGRFTEYVNGKPPRNVVRKYWFDKQSGLFSQDARAHARAFLIVRYSGQSRLMPH